MALVQQVLNGAVVDNPQTQKKEKGGGNLDKEDFLKLLVAEMQYQDPLEPSTNTDYVAQLATFTQVEASENMVNTMEQMEATDLVGKTVIVKQTSATTGDTNYVTGVVDYVVKEKGGIFLSIDDNLYSIDDLDTVANDEYMTAVTLSNTFNKLVSALPGANVVTLGDEAQIESVRAVYNDLTEYQKGFVKKEDLDRLSEVETRLKALQALRDAVANNAVNDSKDDEESDKKVADKVSASETEDEDEVDDEEELEDDEIVADGEATEV